MVSSRHKQFQIDIKVRLQLQHTCKMTQMSGNADLERFVPHKCLRNIPVLKAENKTISKSFNAEYLNNVKNAILALSRPL